MRSAPPRPSLAAGPTDNSRLNLPEKNRCTSSAEQDQGKPRTFTTKPSPPSAPSIIVSSLVLASKQAAGLQGGGAVLGTRLRNSHLNGPPTSRRPAGSGRRDGSPAREDGLAPGDSSMQPGLSLRPDPQRRFVRSVLRLQAKKPLAYSLGGDKEMAAAASAPPPQTSHTIEAARPAGLSGAATPARHSRLPGSA